jgi:Na+/melibiose symporter-like transporter
MNAKNRSIYVDSARVQRFLMVMLLAGLAHGLYRGVQDNYLAEIVKINEFERGIVEFFRELPGLLLIFILATMYRFSETKVFKIGTAITLTGTLGLLLFGTGKFIVVLFMVCYSRHAGKENDIVALGQERKGRSLPGHDPSDKPWWQHHRVPDGDRPLLHLS